MPQWDADVVVDEELVRALLAEQFPELDASSARPLGEGWDNSVWAVEERLAFRFPRRAIAAPLVERELAALGRLAALLPAPVPEPLHVGRPSERYPWSFFGCPLLRGVEPVDAGLSEDDRATIGAELGRFLHVLHAPETRVVVATGARLPVDPNRRGDMGIRVERTREQLRALEDAGLWRAPTHVVRMLEAAERLRPPTDAPSLVHGDLHLRHVLVDGRRLSGVIDWGDVCLADPAIDLVLYWSFLPPGGRSVFEAGYGEIPEERLLRARVVSLFLCAILALYARDVGQRALEREALAGIERTLVD